jgi:hypothetical protein
MQTTGVVKKQRRCVTYEFIKHYIRRLFNINQPIHKIIDVYKM